MSSDAFIPPIHAENSHNVLFYEMSRLLTDCNSLPVFLDASRVTTNSANVNTNLKSHVTYVRQSAVSIIGSIMIWCSQARVQFKAHLETESRRG